jgi:hypothetical protein
MQKIVLVQSAVITMLVIALVLIMFGSAHGWQTGVAYAGTGGDDNAPPPTRAVDPVTPAAPNAIPTTTVYFDPQDNTNNGTVVILYNTTAVTQTVVVKSYWQLGVLYGPWNVNVGPHGLAHVITDQLAVSPPGSWADSVYANFTDSTTYATLDVPAGVHVDGYIVFNSPAGLIDPNTYQSVVPLRFSTDPYTVMLPTVNR